MIRFAREADVPAMLAIYAPFVLETSYSFEYEVPSEAAFLTRFRRFTEQFPWLVWEEGGQVLGYAYACAPFERAAYSWCAEPSIYLAPHAQSRGIGRKLYGALEELLRLQGYQVLYAIITDENLGSLAFHKAVGYRVRAEMPGCGYKFGRWMGVAWMEKRLKTGEIPSEMPIKCSDVVKNNRKALEILDTLSLS